MIRAPLAGSRHRKGVPRGTSGGADPLLTPTEIACKGVRKSQLHVHLG